MASPRKSENENCLVAWVLAYYEVMGLFYDGRELNGQLSSLARILTLHGQSIFVLPEFIILSPTWLGFVRGRNPRERPARGIRLVCLRT